MTRRALTATLAALAAAAFAAVPAYGHVQVEPAEVAPEDPVLFTVLVPNESDVATVKVEVAVPPGVIPFSFEEVPGWRRSQTTKPNGATRSIVWRGRLPPGSFVRLPFLSGTPSRQGPIAWKAVETYADGQKVRWIGPPGSEEPAAVTQVSSSAPRRNAGGESEGGSAAAASSDASGDDASGDEADGGGDTLALAIAIAALVLALAGLGTAYATRRAGRASGPATGDR